MCHTLFLQGMARMQKSISLKSFILAQVLGHFFYQTLNWEQVIEYIFLVSAKDDNWSYEYPIYGNFNMFKVLNILQIFILSI